MKILAIIGNYYPVPSSVANCVKPLLSSLIDNGHDIYLISNFPGKSTLHLNLSNGVIYTGIHDRYVYQATRINTYFEPLNKSKLNKIKKLALKLPFYLRYQVFCQEKHMGGWSIRQSVNRCLELDNESEFDLVISFSQPFTSHLIAKKFISKIKKKTPWIIYQYDPYSKNKEIMTQNRIFYSNSKRQEEECLELADAVVVTPELLKFYEENDFSKYLHKMKSINYILPKPDKNNTEYADKMSDNYTLMYAGGFYKSIRNPIYMMQLLIGLSIDVTCEFFTSYNDKEFLEFINNSPNRFFIKQKVSQTEVIEELRKADFLLSIGNTVELQVPAKIFEYMGLGKPIIHFSKIKDDPALKYLNLYPMALIINEYEEDMKGHIQKFEHFLKKMKGKQLSYEEVVTYLPEHDLGAITQKLLSIMKSVM